MNLIKRLLKDEEGQGLIEYGLLLALISVAVVVAIIAIGGNVKDLWGNAQGNLGNATGQITQPQQ